LSLSAGTIGLENPLVISSQEFCLEKKMMIGSEKKSKKKCLLVCGQEAIQSYTKLQFESESQRPSG
jgi:hypothetical protein